MEPTTSEKTAEIMRRGGPVPPLRRVNFNGADYVSVADLAAWWEYIADDVVDPDSSPEEQADHQVVANVLRIMSTFTTERVEKMPPFPAIYPPV